MAASAALASLAAAAAEAEDAVAAGPRRAAAEELLADANLAGATPVDLIDCTLLPPPRSSSSHRSKRSSSKDKGDKDKDKGAKGANKSVRVLLTGAQSGRRYVLEPSRRRHSHTHRHARGAVPVRLAGDPTAASALGASQSSQLAKPNESDDEAARASALAASSSLFAPGTARPCTTMSLDEMCATVRQSGGALCAVRGQRLHLVFEWVPPRAGMVALLGGGDSTAEQVAAAASAAKKQAAASSGSTTAASSSSSSSASSESESESESASEGEDDAGETKAEAAASAQAGGGGGDGDGDGGGASSSTKKTRLGEKPSKKSDDSGSLLGFASGVVDEETRRIAEAAADSVGEGRAVGVVAVLAFVGEEAMLGDAASGGGSSDSLAPPTAAAGDDKSGKSSSSSSSSGKGRKHRRSGSNSSSASSSTSTSGGGKGHRRSGSTSSSRRGGGGGGGSGSGGGGGGARRNESSTSNGSSSTAASSTSSSSRKPPSSSASSRGSGGGGGGRNSSVHTEPHRSASTTVPGSSQPRSSSIHTEQVPRRPKISPSLPGGVIQLPTNSPELGRRARSNSSEAPGKLESSSSAASAAAAGGEKLGKSAGGGGTLGRGSSSRARIEDAMWQEAAREYLGDPPPSPVLKEGASEDEYKEYMRLRYDKESWENKPILLGRRMRREHEEAGGKMLVDGGVFKPASDSCVHDPTLNPNSTVLSPRRAASRRSGGQSGRRRQVRGTAGAGSSRNHGSRGGASGRSRAAAAKAEAEACAHEGHAPGTEHVKIKFWGLTAPGPHPGEVTLLRACKLYNLSGADWDAAAALFVEAAAQGNIVARGWMARNGVTPEGMINLDKVEEKTAVQLFKQATKLPGKRCASRLLAQYWLGAAYCHGDLGLEKNCEMEVKLYTAAALQGSAEAQDALAFCYLNGDGCTADPKKAASLWAQAAESGHAEAVNQLGWCYENGVGVAEDKLEAMVLYRKAAELGSAAGYHNVGRYFAGGLGGMAQSSDEAVKWLAKAVTLGSADAKVRLDELLHGPNGPSSEGWKLALDAVEQMKEAAGEVIRNELRTAYTEIASPAAAAERSESGLAAEAAAAAASQAAAVAEATLAIKAERDAAIKRAEAAEAKLSTTETDRDAAIAGRDAAKKALEESLADLARRTRERDDAVLARDSALLRLSAQAEERMAAATASLSAVAASASNSSLPDVDGAAAAAAAGAGDAAAACDHTDVRAEIPWSELELDKTPEGELGAGSYGEVLKGFWLGTPVAVKKLHRAIATGKPLENFEAEIKLLRRVHHPFIVQLLGTSEKRRRQVLVMELCSGGSLEDALTAGNCAPALWVLMRLEEAAGALAYLHDHLAVAHRDLKPGNILLTAGPGVDMARAKVADLGLASALQASAGRGGSNSISGTMTYLAPEVIAEMALGKVRAAQSLRVDQYAFATMTVEVLANDGGLTNREEGLELLKDETAVTAVLADKAKLDSATVEALAKPVILACASETPDERPSFSEVAKMLGAAARLGSAVSHAKKA